MLKLLVYFSLFFLRTNTHIRGLCLGFICRRRTRDFMSELDGIQSIYCVVNHKVPGKEKRVFLYDWSK